MRLTLGPGCCVRSSDLQPATQSFHAAAIACAPLQGRAYKHRGQSVGSDLCPQEVIGYIPLIAVLIHLRVANLRHHCAASRLRFGGCHSAERCGRRACKRQVVERIRILASPDDLSL